MHIWIKSDLNLVIYNDVCYFICMVSTILQQMSKYTSPYDRYWNSAYGEL